MPTKGDWLSKWHQSADLDKLKTLNYEYEKLLDANADVMSREVRKIRKVWGAGSLHIGWSDSMSDPNRELHRYDVACYKVGSFYVNKVPLRRFTEDLISALKKNVEMSEKVSLQETPESVVALSQGVLYLYVLIVPVYNTRNKVTRNPNILKSFQMIEHDLTGKEEETDGCDVRIAASYYARQVADHVDEKMKDIATKEKWDVTSVKLKVGKSFLSGLANRWSTSYKGVYDKPMIPLVILKDSDLPGCLQDGEFAASCGRDNARVGDTRDEIAMRIEEAIARRGKLWGYDLDNDQKGDHPTPKIGGGDASVVYLVHIDLVRCAVRTIEKTKRACAAVGGSLVPHLDERDEPSRIGRDVNEIARAIGGLLVYEDSELARKMRGLFIGDTEECNALKAETEDLKAENAKLINSILSSKY